MSKKIARKVLCVMDAFWKRHYSLKKDSTLLLLSELQKRHFEIFLTSLEDLNKIKPTDFDFILMRKDPPVDQKYLKACRTLETFHKTTPVINNPSVIRQWSEKSMILNFPQWIPPTIITKSFRQASIFLKKYGEVVLKPLNSYASKGIRLISSSRDIKNIKTSVMLQAYLAHIKTKGEKRIFMVDGKAHGALLKIPSKKNFLANPDLGARLSSTTLSLREKKMCREIGQFLKKNGIFFAGLDVIDEHLTEINFTSPGLLWEWNELTKQRHEKKIVNLMIQYTKNLYFLLPSPVLLCSCSPLCIPGMETTIAR
ncbi:MAG: hypothetical protein IPJ69_10770 [Deltaproteobacteria bacterium]|nr:MAG: hypothetical protein IPJ69_10770 [Deltaproteobacteria bacterium]